MTGDTETVRRVVEQAASLDPGSLLALITPQGYGDDEVLALLADSDVGASLVDPADAAGVARALASQGAEWVIVPAIDPDRHVTTLEAIARWADHPSGVRLALAGRSGRLRRLLPWRPNVLILDDQDLRIGTDESVDMLLRLCPEMTPTEADAIAAACDGWPAALTAAGRWASRHLGQPALAWLNGRGSEEIFGRPISGLPPRKREFLLGTAFLDNLCADLCDHVLESSDAGVLLTELEDDFGFIKEVPHKSGSAQMRWVVRHPLLTAALRRLTRGEDLRDRHMRAADWFMGVGRIESAMDHLMGAGRMHEAEELMRQHEDAVMAGGKAHVARGWYERLGPATAQSTHIHLLRLGWSQALTGNRDGARLAAHNLRAQMSLAATHDPTVGLEDLGTDAASDLRELEAQMHLLLAYVGTMTGDTRQAATEARRACELFAGKMEHNSHQLAPLLLVKGLLLCGDLESAQRELARAESLPFPTDVLREVGLASVASMTSALLGNIYQARTRAEGALTWLSSQGLDPMGPNAFRIPLVMAMCLFELGDTAAALAQLRAVATAVEAQSVASEQVLTLTTMARVHLSRGELNDSMGCIDQARQALLMSAPESELMSRVDEIEAIVRIMGGDYVRADRLVRQLPERNQRNLLWARLSIHRQGASVNRLLAGFQATTPREEATVELLLAMGAMTRSTSLAEKHLSAAAEVAVEHGMLLLLTDTPAGFTQFAEEVAQRQADDRIAVLVRQARAARAVGEPRLPDAGGIGAHVPLSPGEVVLLPLLSSRDSNEQLAARLGVSVNTIKTRLQRLYRKLGASNRDEAVAMARSRNLLS